MRRLAAVAVASIVLLGAAGCGNEDEPTSAAESSSTPAPTPSATLPPITAPAVSLQTSCGLIFEGKSKPLDRVVSFIIAESVSQREADRAQSALDELREVAQTAQPELQVQLGAFSDRAQDVLNAANDPSSTPAIDSTSLKAAGLEVANICKDSL